MNKAINTTYIQMNFVCADGRIFHMLLVLKYRHNNSAEFCQANKHIFILTIHKIFQTKNVSVVIDRNRYKSMPFRPGKNYN